MRQVCAELEAAAFSGCSQPLLDQPGMWPRGPSRRRSLNVQGCSIAGLVMMRKVFLSGGNHADVAPALRKRK